MFVGTQLCQSRSMLRWRRFGLRALMFFVAIIAGMLAFSSYRLTTVRQHTASLQQLKEVGAFVAFGKGTARYAPIEEPGLIAKFVYLPDVTYVSLHGAAEFGDDDLALLLDFPEIEIVDLTGTRITDEGLPKLRQLRKLREVILDATHVTDSGINEISSLPSLERLFLRMSSDYEGFAHQPDVSDQAVREIRAKRPSLEVEQ